MIKKILAIVLMALTLASSALAWYPQGAGMQYQSYGFGYSGASNIQAMHWSTNYYGSSMYSRYQPYGGQYTGPSVVYSGPYSRVKPFQYGQVSYGGYGYGSGYGWGRGYGVNPYVTRPVVFY